MHRLLSIPELVLIFLNTLDKKSLLQATLTCKTWKEPGLDNLWKDLTSLYPLVHLLGPVVQIFQETKSLGWDFVANCLEPTDWARFLRYNERVQTLSINLEDIITAPGPFAKPDNHLGYTVFFTIAYTRPIQELLPNLLRFDFKSARIGKEFLAPLLLFTGTNVQRMTVFNCPPSHTTPTSLTYIPQRSPNIQHLTLGQPLFDPFVLASLVRNLKKLKSLASNTAALKPVLDTAGQSPDLESLKLCAHSPRGQDLPVESLKFQPESFARLTDLYLRGLINSSLELFEWGNVPQALRRLTIEGRTQSPGDRATRRLLAALPGAAPQLDFLAVYDHSSTPTDAPLTFEDIGPVCSLTGLSALYIRHAHGVDLTEEELGRVAESFSNLHSLVLSYTLNPQGSDGSLNRLQWSNPTLPLTALDTIAAKRPDIKVLALCLDGKRLTPGFKVTPPPERVLSKLIHMDLTLSPIGDPVRVAEYLAPRIVKSIRLDWKSFRAANREEMAELLKGAEEGWPITSRFVDALHRQSRRMEKGFAQQLAELGPRERPEVAEVGTWTGDD